jgi:hypothetical protein
MRINHDTNTYSVEIKREHKVHGDIEETLCVLLGTLALLVALSFVVV